MQIVSYPKPKQPMPQNAKKVFDGLYYDVYHWDQEEFDGKIRTYEKLKRRSTVNIFPVTDTYKILLSKQKQPGLDEFIGAFGGKIEEKEDILEAAKRELLEETGIKATKWKLWFSTQIFEKIEWPIYTFLAKDLTFTKEKNLEGGEKISILEVTFDELIDIVFQENYRDIEITLEIAKTIRDKSKLERLKKLFFK